jgi:hypothetical protein
MDSPINNPTLGYVNKNQDLHYIELDSFEACITLPEDLIFVSLREGTEHVFAPLTKFPFSNIERDIIGLKGSFDMSYIKDAHYRRANSKFCPNNQPDPIIAPLLITNFIGNVLHFNYPYAVDMQLYIGGNWRTDWYGVMDDEPYNVYTGYEVRLHDPARVIFSPSYIISGGS